MSLFNLQHSTCSHEILAMIKNLKIKIKLIFLIPCEDVVTLSLIIDINYYPTSYQTLSIKKYRKVPILTFTLNFLIEPNSTLEEVKNNRNTFEIFEILFCSN